MIRIIEEALAAPAKPVPAEPKQRTRSIISSTLQPYLNNDILKAQREQIQNLIHSVDTVQNILKNNKPALAALQAGVDSIAFSLSESLNPKNMKGIGWQILPADNEKAILNISEIRNWILDQGITMSEIVAALNAIANPDLTVTPTQMEEAKSKESAFVQKVDGHTEQDEIKNKTVGHVHVSLKCPTGKDGCSPQHFDYIVERLYEQGRKGKGWNQFGSYERLLSVMTGGTVFPQDGTDGAGDITCGKGKLAEVKCIDGSSLMTTPEIPSGNGNNCLLMVLSGKGGNHQEFDVLVFRTQEMIDALSIKDNKETKLSTFKSLITGTPSNASSIDPSKLIPRKNKGLFSKPILSKEEKYQQLRTAVNKWFEWNMKEIDTNLNDQSDYGVRGKKYGMLQKNSPVVKTREDSLVSCCFNWVRDKLEPKLGFSYTRNDIRYFVQDNIDTYRNKMNKKLANLDKKKPIKTASEDSYEVLE